MQQIFGKLILVSTVMIALIAFGCSKPESDESKQRVLEKKDVDEAVTQREVKLTEIDISKIPNDIGELEKIILMTQEEVAWRLKPYRFEGELSYTTTRQGKKVTLDERQVFEQAANGDFHINVFNDKSRSFELFWTEGKLYERMGESSFRATSTQGKHIYWREKTYASLDRFYKYFRGHLNFSLPQDTTYEGRPALKIAISLDPNGKTPEEDLPTNYNYPNQYALSTIAVDKMINSNRKRVSRYEEAKGYIIIDKAQALPLAYEIYGKYVVPISAKKQKQITKDGSLPGKEVIFEMKTSYKIKDIGDKIEVVKPKHRKPSTRKKPVDNIKPLLPEGSKINKEGMPKAALKKSHAKPKEAPAP